jgi:hypothetical protein
MYSVLRLLAFLVPLGIMMLFPIFREQYWLALLFAALIGVSLSIIFLRRPLDDVASGLAARREARRHETEAEKDADVEDAANAALRHEDDAR